MVKLGAIVSWLTTRPPNNALVGPANIVYFRVSLLSSLANMLLLPKIFTHTAILNYPQPSSKVCSSVMPASYNASWSNAYKNVAYQFWKSAPSCLKKVSYNCRYDKSEAFGKLLSGQLSRLASLAELLGGGS